MLLNIAETFFDSLQRDYLVSVLHKTIPVILVDDHDNWHGTTMAMSEVVDEYLSWLRGHHGIG
jgi:hypothetical protein